MPLDEIISSFTMGGCITLLFTLCTCMHVYCIVACLILPIYLHGTGMEGSITRGTVHHPSFHKVKINVIRAQPSYFMYTMYIFIFQD